MKCGMGHLGEVISFGLSKNKTIACKNVFDDPYETDTYLDKKCSANTDDLYDDFFSSSLPQPKNIKKTFTPSAEQKQYIGYDKMDPEYLIKC